MDWVGDLATVHDKTPHAFFVLFDLYWKQTKNICTYINVYT